MVEFHPPNKQTNKYVMKSHTFLACIKNHAIWQKVETEQVWNIWLALMQMYVLHNLF